MGFSRSPVSPSFLALLIALSSCAPACGRGAFAVDVTVARGMLEVPNRVDFDIAELAEPGGAILTTSTRSTPGADLFASEGTSNHLLVEVSRNAGAVRVRATAYDAADVELGAGVVDVPREAGTVMITLTLVAPGGGDAGLDAGSDAGSDAGPDGGGAGCGNGAREGAEQCDGSDLAGATCASLGIGFVGGVLACGAGCTFDVLGCIVATSCGDGAIDAGEECDGADLGGATCTSLGLGAGTLACSPTCIFDPVACAVCGNGVLEGPEPCDEANLAGATCASLGYTGGVLGCATNCRLHDEAACTNAGAPTVPVLRKPINGTYLGSIYVTGSRRPTFTWEASSGAGAITYDLAYSMDSTFMSGVTTLSGPATSQTPATDLPASTTAPVGARYWWRVRACSAAICSAWSRAWYVDVGRSGRDLNGDGYADVAVGASSSTAGGMLSGAAYVYFGGAAGVDTTAEGTITGSPGDSLAEVAIADVNADGFADLLAGSYAGLYVRVYLGGAGAVLDTGVDSTVFSTSGADAFGSTLVAADMDADGYPDVVAGAQLYLSSMGRVDIYRGGPGAVLDGTSDATFLGTVSLGLFGQRAGAGDVDGDGFADVIVGAPNAPPSGQAYVFLGGATLDTTSDVTLDGVGGDSFGSAVAGAGDLNGDGFSDVVVGGYLGDAGGSNAGEAFIFFGASSGLDTGAEGFVTGATNDTLGIAVSAAGDVNGDGFDDVIIGAAQLDFGPTGFALVYFGGAGGAFDMAADGSLAGPLAMSRFGEAVAAAGDVNGDGFADIIVGAHAAPAGAAYVFHGAAGASFDAGADTSLLGLMMGSAFGISVE